MKFWTKGLFLSLLLAIALSGCGRQKDNPSETSSAQRGKVTQAGTQSGIQSAPQTGGQEVTMEEILAWYQNGEMGTISFQDWSSYDNFHAGENGPDGVVELSYNGVSYELIIYVESQEVRAIHIRNERQEDRLVYAPGDPNEVSVTDLNEYLNHDTILDQEISYQLPDGLQNGSCYYDILMDNSIGRLWFSAEEQQKGILGIPRTMMWSCDGGVTKINNSLLTVTGDGLLRFSWRDSSGKGISAGGDGAVLNFEHGELQKAAMQMGEGNVEGSIEGVLIRQVAVAGDPVWYLPPAQSEEKAFSLASELNTQLVPVQLWIMCARADDQADHAYVFFLNAQKYSRTDAEKLLTSLRFLQSE